MVRKDHWCGRFNENGSHRLTYLDGSASENGVILEELGGVALYGESASLGVGFRISKPQARPSVFL